MLKNTSSVPLRGALLQMLADVGFRGFWGISRAPVAVDASQMVLQKKSNSTSRSRPGRSICAISLDAGENATAPGTLIRPLPAAQASPCKVARLAVCHRLGRWKTPAGHSHSHSRDCRPPDDHGDRQQVRNTYQRRNANERLVHLRLAAARQDRTSQRPTMHNCAVRAALPTWRTYTGLISRRLRHALSRLGIRNDPRKPDHKSPAC